MKTDLSHSFPVRKELLSKKKCLLESRKILRNGHIKKMNQKQIAKEIYFHAVAYYFSLWLGRRGIHWKYIKSHAETIDLEDKGDTMFRRFYYYILWMFPSVK